MLLVENYLKRSWEIKKSLVIWHKGSVVDLLLICFNFPGGSVVKNPPALQQLQEGWVPTMGWEDPLEKGMAIHSSILAWKIPWMEGTWWTTVHRVTKSWKWLKQLSIQHNLHHKWRHRSIFRKKTWWRTGNVLASKWKCNQSLIGPIHNMKFHRDIKSYTEFKKFIAKKKKDLWLNIPSCEKNYVPEDFNSHKSNCRKQYKIAFICPSQPHFYSLAWLNKIYFKWDIAIIKFTQKRQIQRLRRSVNILTAPESLLPSWGSGSESIRMNWWSMASV